MIKGIAPGWFERDAGHDIRTLMPADVEKLSLRGHPRLNDGDAEALVIQSPGLSKWHRESGEFILVTPWRHRPEIPTLAINSAFRHEDALLDAALESSREQGAAAFIMLEAFETRRPSFYQRHGFDRLEKIVTYEHSKPRDFLSSMADRRQQFVHLDRNAGGIASQVVEIDHAAFPWLWWNSVAEFSSYIALPNVEVWAGLLDGDVVSYVGFTHYRHWSHLDRIAIHPRVQRMGLGREALHFAVERMVSRGAMRVGLSTQGDNTVSRNMYESVGFRPTPDHDYDVYGVILPNGRALTGQQR